MVRLVYGECELKVVDGYSMTKSSQEVTFNSIICDFTGHKKEDLPDKYQEVKLMEDGNILFFGYVDSYTFKEMRELDVNTEIEITLLSPMKLATLRTVILSGTYKLLDLIPQVLQPLLDDGYVIEELEVTNRTITVNYPLNTIEYCMNNLSNKFNFWWFIDEQKKIHIKDISLMLSKKPDYKYDNEDGIPYLQYIKPTVNSEGYANVVNFKNVRVYENSNISFNGSQILSNKNGLIDKQLTTPIKKDGQIDFNYPCDIKEENIVKSAESNGVSSPYINSILYGFRMRGNYSNGNSFEVYVKYDENTKEYSISSNAGFSDKESDNTKEFLFIRDSFFSNLITGIKYNSETTNIASITELKSDSILVYNITRMYNDSAIYDKKGIISGTGIVETTVDMNESWKTLEELQEIGISYMNKNGLKLDGELELKIDTTCNIKVGDTIKIDKLLFTGTYIVTQITEIYTNGYKEWIVMCKNGNMLSNYIDIFRGENTQNNEEKTYKVSMTHYIEEKINEVFEVVKW